MVSHPTVLATASANRITVSTRGTLRRSVAILLPLLALVTFVPGLVGSLRAQTYLSEDFESGLPSSNFSLQGSGAQWTVDTSYYYGGAKSARLHTSGSVNGYLVSRSLNLSSSTSPLLTFYHVAAIEKYYDQALVEISKDGGVTWSIPSNTQYNGNSWRKSGANLGTISTYPEGPYFDAQSRPEWDIRFTNAAALPSTGSGLWVKEVFDLSAYRGAAVKIRFRIKASAGGDWYGWLVDDVTVSEAPSTRIAGTRVIGTGGYSSFRAATQALADSGVGAGGVTILVSPGTYTDSLNFGYWRGVSASNRVRFKATPGTVFIQRTGIPSPTISQPTYQYGYTNAQQWESVVFMSGTQFTTLDGITVQQQNMAGGNYNADVGLYMTNGCRNDSVVNCTMNMSARYYSTCGFMLVTNQYSCAPNATNVNNKFVDDTVYAWNGAVMTSQFTTAYDSLNEISGSTQGKTFFYLGLQSGSIYSYSTMYGIELYGQSELLLKNVKMTVTPYGTSSSGFTCYSVYAIGNLYKPVFTDNLFVNYGYPSAPTTYASNNYGFYMSSGNIFRPRITNNTFSDWYSSTQGYLMYMPTSSIYEPLIQGNVATRLAFKSTSTYLHYLSGVTRPRIIGNQIKDIRLGSFGITSASTLYGYYLSSVQSPVVVYNNMISNWSLNNTSSSSFTLYGIYFSPSPPAVSGIGAVRDSICHNSVYFSDTHGNGTSYPYSTSYCFYFVPNTTTGYETHIYNNVFSNRQSNGTSSVAYSWYRSSTSGTVFSDHNNLYANTVGSGTDAMHRTGYYGGTICYTLTDWRTASTATNDRHSIAELAPWSSSDSLHLSTSSATRMESSGKYLASVTTDIDGDARSTAPDIGADEASATMSNTDDVGPAITVLRAPKTTGSSGVTVSAYISDQTAVATGSSTAPRMYYRVVPTLTWSNVTGSPGGNNLWTFTTSSSIAAGSIVQFYLAAQDTVSTPNVTTMPIGGSGATPPGSTAPSTYDTIRVIGPLNGDYLVGGSGANFPTLKAALDSLDLVGVSGPVRFLINTSLLTETGQLAIFGPIPGSSATNTVTIKPNVGITATIQPSNTANSYGILINGASNIIIDGSNTNGGTTRDLTFSGGSTSSTTANLIQFFVQPALGLTDGSKQDCRNLTFKNLILRGGYNTPSASSDYGILLQGNAPYVQGGQISDVTITNNVFSQMANGVRLLSQSPDYYLNPIKRVTITNNTIGAGVSGTDSIWIAGILMQGVDTVTITNNNISNLQSGTTSNTMYGIQLGTACTNVRFTNNQIHNAKLQASSGALYGIYQSSTYPPATNSLFANNFIYDFHQYGTTYSSGTSSTSPAVAGIFIASGGGDVIAYNTVHLFDSLTTTTTTNLQYTEALGFSSSAYNETVVNNILSNGLRIGPNNGLNLGYMAYYGNAQLGLTDNNIIYAPGPKGAVGYMGVFGLPIYDLDSLRGWVGGDARSWYHGAPFTSRTDPHLLTSVMTRAESGGIPVPGITTDFDGQTRNASTPDIGADEGAFATSGGVDVLLQYVSNPTNNWRFITGTGLRPVVTVRNDGMTTSTNVPVVASLLDSVTLTATTITSTIDSIRPGEAKTITMDSLTIANVRSYGLRIYTNASSDVNRGNDSSGTYRLVGITGLNGVYTVGVGRWAPTIKAAFDSLAFYGLSGPTTFSLTDNQYSELGITTGYVGNGGLIPGANPNIRLRIKPAAGVSPILDMYGNTGRSVSTYAGTYYPAFGLQNTQYLTIDGCNTENGTTRNMTIRFHPSSSGGSAAVVFNGAQYDSLKNCVIIDSTYYSTMSGSGYASYGVVLSSPSVGAPPPTSYNTIYNNWIRDNYYGVYAYGNFPWYGKGNVIAKNLITRFTYAGLYSQYQQDYLYQYNTIQSDTTAYVNNLYGMYIYGYQNASYGRIDGNRIQKFRAYNTPSYTYMYGLYLYHYQNGGAPTTVSNNLIAIDHDTSTDWVYLYGVYRYTYQAASPVNMYFNTIYTGGLGSYTYYYTFQDYYGFGDFLNNIVENRRPSQYMLYDYNPYNYLQNYDHNLLWYTGTLGYVGYWYNGTSGYTSSTFANWQSNTSLDQHSWSEPQVWQDSVGGNFAPITSLATRIESHGVPIPGITTDINGNTRNARYPDIGAFEGTYPTKFDINLTGISMDQPAAGLRVFPSTPVTASATFRQSGLTTVSTAPIGYRAIDASGVVRATYSTSLSNLAPNVATSAASFNFTPTTPGMWTIQAFGNHASEEYTLDDTVSVQIRVMDPLEGTYTVGVGQYAPTMKAALDSLSYNGIKGAVTFLLMDNSYSEPSLTANIPFGQSSVTSVTFKPAPGRTPIVTFNPTVGAPWGMKFNSVTRYTIDGSNTVGGTTRDLQFQMGNANGQVAVLVSDSLGGSGSTNTTIKNTRIYGGGTSSSYYGVCVGGMTAGSAGSNNSVTIQNNEVRNAGFGVCVSGLASSPNTALVVTQNTIGPAVGDNTNRIGVEGIRLGYVSSPQITRNEVRGIYATTNSVAGIDLTTGTSAATLTKNSVHDIEAKSSSFRALGVLDNSASSTQYVNNMIWHITSGMANTGAAGVNAGLYLSATNGASLYFNSIYLTGNRDTVAATSGLAPSAALYVASTSGSLTMKNNIFASKQTEPNGGAKAYGAVFENATSLSSADNDMYSGLGTKAGLVGRVGSTDYSRMADLRGALGSREANGFGGDVLFVSDGDLHINPLVPSLVESGGSPVPGITDDKDGDTRDAIKPDVGADEGTFAKAVDVVAVSIDNPLNNSVYRPFAKTTAPVVTFRNAATGTGTNIPVTFVTVDSLVSTTKYSNRTIPTLGPNASVQVTFDSLVLPDIGSYGLKAFASYGFDVDNTNDTTGSITVKVCAPMFGTYYIGAGRDFTSLALAAKTLHDCGVQAQVRMFLTDAVYNETLPVSFTGITGLTSANTVTIRPNTGVNVVMNITSQVGTDYGILVDSVNWLTLDGSNVAGGTSRNWRINMIGANANASAIALRDGSRGQVQNLVVRGMDMSSGAGILVQPTRVKMTNTTISNNDIQNVQTAVNVMTTAFVDSAIMIQNNAITRWSQTGIQIGDMAKNVMVRGNTVRSDTTTSSTSMTGIALSGANTTNVELGANKVMDLTTSGTNPVLKGIVLANTASASTRVYDNMVSLGRNTSMTSATLYGVQLQPGSNAWLQNNTIAIGGAGVTSGSSYGVYVDAPNNLTFYNNIVANTRSNSTGAGKHYAFNSPNSPGGYFTSDYNNLYAYGTGGVLGRAVGMDITTLPMWRMITNGTAWGLQDRNSYSEAPNFVGTSDLHLTLVPNRNQNGGKPGLVGPNGQQDYDIDGNVRAFIADVGADELDGPRNMRLKGAYTIGGTTSQFATLKDAVVALNANGVDGAVDFYLAQGTEILNSPLRFVAADGVGPNWPVRIHPASGYTSEIMGQAPTGQNLVTVVVFDSAANNITFDGENTTNNGKRSLTIRNATTDFANSAIVLTNGASSNTIKTTNVLTPLDNVRIDPVTDGMGVISLVGGVYGGNLQSNVIDNDSIANGTRGVFAYGAPANWKVSNLTVRKSKIVDFNESGVFFGAGTTNSFADGNYITTVASPGAASTVRGIRIASDDNAISNRAGNNWVINLRSTGTSNLSGIDLTDGQQPMIFNNFISLDDYTAGSVRGIDEASSSTSIQPTAARIFFNSINIYGDKSPNSAPDYAIMVGAGDNIGNADSIVNNVYSLHRNNYGPNMLFAMGLAQFSDATYANNNDYYTPAGSVAQVGAINYETLSALRAAPSWSTRDANAITGDPVFKSNLDLHIGAYTSALFNKAQYLPSVTTDIDGQGRDLAPRTEIGADENGAFGVLPVELMSLEARGLDKKVDLTFATANESNVRGFAVMRSEGDDKHFTEIANASSDRALVARGLGGRTTDYTFSDNGVTNGKTYYYQIASLESDGSRRAYEKIAVATPNAPLGFAIESAYPNPYRTNSGDLTIGYSVNVQTESLTLAIVDLTGRTVRTLVTGSVEKAGTYSASWNGMDDNGSELASGTYVVSMSAMIDGSVRSTTQKVVLTK